MVVLALLVGLLASCREVKIGARCATKEAASSGPWVAVCKNGRWTRWITKQDGQLLLQAAQRRRDAEAASLNTTNPPTTAPAPTTPPTYPPNNPFVPPTTIPPPVADCAVLCQIMGMPNGVFPSGDVNLEITDIPAASPDGKWVAFVAITTDNATGTNLGVRRAFAKNVVTGQLLALDTAPDGTFQPDPHPTVPSGSLEWSPDSTRVLFATSDHLINGVTGYQLYARNVTTGVATLISQDATGHPGNAESGTGAWSPDGTKVSFVSSATNWAVAIPPQTDDLFIKNLATGAVAIVSVNAGGQPSNGGIGHSYWSPDGRRIAYVSTGTNLIPGAGFGEDIVVYDLMTGTSMLADSTPDGTRAYYGGDYPAWMSDSRTIVFETVSSDLTDHHIGPVIVSKNIVTGAVTPVSVEEDGSVATSASFSISPDGRHVACATYDPSVIVRDVLAGTSQTLRLNGTVLTGGPPIWSPDGTKLALFATNDIAPGDHNSVADIYVITPATGTALVASAAGDGIARGSSTPGAPLLWNGTGTMLFFDLDGIQLTWTGWNFNSAFVMRRI